MRCAAWVIVTTVSRSGKALPTPRVRSVGDAYARLVAEPPMPVISQQGRRGASTSGEPPVTVADLRDWMSTHRKVPSVFMPSPPQPDAVRCDGVLVASVKAVDEPYMGGSSAALEIVVTCDRCGHTYHGPSMPTTSDEISRLVTAAIAVLPQDAGVSVVEGLGLQSSNRSS